MDQLERNKQVVQRAWAAYDAGDEAAFAECGTADKRTIIDRIVAEGDLVVTHSRSEATHTGEYLGLAPTGKRLTLDEMLICRMAGDRIAESWQITTGGFMQQLTGRKAGTGDNQA